MPLATKLPWVLVLALCAWAAGPVQSQPAPTACDAEPDLGALDFWLGDWDVFVRGQQVGQNRIRKVLDGCAVTEEWTDVRGRRGNSLFYYRAADAAWKQVWVTDRALARGGLKEKTLVARFADGGVRFQGEIPLAEGGSYLDRTTLTPVHPDTVRQVIEVSTDGGAGWQTTFDALYARRR